MSRAFVSEAAAEANAVFLPERPISAATNLITPRGFEHIEREIARLQEAHALTAQGDPDRAAADRDLRYWRARRASAIVVPPVTGVPDTVSFGCWVTLRRDGAPLVTYQIVGEDEADPPHGLLSWMSPLAAALIGARIGETVEVNGRANVTVERIMGA